MCNQYDGEHMYECGGQGGGKARYDYFDQNGNRRCYRCHYMNEKKKYNHDPYQCPATKGNRDDCPYYKWDSVRGIRER